MKGADRFAFVFIIVSFLFPSSRGGFLAATLWMDNNSFRQPPCTIQPPSISSAVCLRPLLSFPLVFSFFLSSPLLPCGPEAGKGPSGLPTTCVEAKRSSLVRREGLDAAAGAMSGMRGSALPGAETQEPATLFREMLVCVGRGGCFLCLSLSSKHLFFIYSLGVEVIFLSWAASCQADWGLLFGFNDNRVP